MLKRIIIGAIAFLILSCLAVFYILNTAQTNYDNALSRTENDFTTEKFVIDQIWELQRKNNQLVVTSYIFIKPQNEDFNLRFSETDAFGENKSKMKILSQIAEGDTINAKVLKNQLAEAREGGFFNWLKRFMQSDRREVTIYKLTDNNRVVSERDINFPDTVESGFIDRLNSTVFFAAIIFVGIIAFIAKKISTRKVSQKA